MSAIPVKEQTEEGKNLYNLFACPSDITQKAIAKAIIDQNHELFNKSITILDLGIGNGWLSFAIVDYLKSQNINDDKIIRVMGIDTSKRWINYLKSSSLPNKNLFEFIKTDFKNWAPEGDSKFDIIISSFFFHHLQDPDFQWKDGLIKALKLLKDDGEMIITELWGDHAGIQTSFDHTFNISDKITDERIKYLRFCKWLVTKINEVTNCSCYKEISSFNVKPIEEFLLINGYQSYSSEIYEYDSNFKMQELIDSLGLKDSRTRSFSAFNIPINQKRLLIKSVKDECQRIFGEHDLEKIEIKALSGCKFYTFKKSLNFIENPLLFKSSEDLREYHSNLVLSKGSDTLNYYNIIVQDTIRILENSFSVKPSIILHYNWNIIKNEWQRELPVLYNIKNGLYKIFNYTYFSNKLNFKTAEFLFRELPEKATLIAQKGSTNGIDVELRRDGSINLITINFSNELFINNKIKIKKISSSFKNQKAINDDYYLINFSDVLNSLNDCEEATDSSDFQTTIKKVNSLVDDFSELLKNIKIYTNNENWELKEITIKKLVQSMYIALLCDFEQILYISSREYIDKISHNEVASGGLLLVYEKKNFDKNNLKQILDLLNLRYRAFSINNFIQKTKLDLFKEQSKTAIISILVDSYSHNISAHSLSALKWWFELRSKILERRFYVGDEKKTTLEISGFEPLSICISQDDLEKTTVPYYSALGLIDSVYNEKFYSLFDFLHFSTKDPSALLKFKKSDQFSSEDKKCNMVSGEIFTKDENLTCFQPQFPVSLDYALFPFFRFLRDKGAFWSGVTRDIAFGGESKSWYKILWEDFANNPLYLGTIAKTEGITKLNVNLSVKKDKKWKTGLFVTIDLSLMDDEECIAKDLFNSEKEIKNRAHDENSYSPYAFVRLGQEFSYFRELLSKEEYNVFLPGGVVGEHALFTIFENQLRNIKHVNKEDLQNHCIEFHISIAKFGEKSELFNVAVWLGHETDMYIDKEKITLWEKVTASIRKPILDINGMPKMGGNSQDKACAAMLFSNKFLNVDDSEKTYYPWIHYTTCKKDDIFKESPSLMINPSKDYEKINYQIDNKNEKGYLKKHFFLWHCEDYYSIKDLEDLKAENISRFKFLIVPTAKYDVFVNQIRKEGVVRLIADDTINNNKSERIKTLKQLYNTWFDFWFNDFEILRVGFKRNQDSVSIVYNKDTLSFDLKINATANNNDQLITLSHGGSDENSACNVRSHGHFWNTYFSKIEDKQPSSFIGKFCEKNATIDDITNDVSRIYDFIEVAATNVMIFDNRLYNRMPKNEEKIEMFRKSLKLNVYEEKDFENHEYGNLKNFIDEEIVKYGIPHVLIVHLSYIEALGYNESKKGYMNSFIENELKDIIKKPNFFFIVITGRGRISWQKDLSLQYSRNTLFKPVESLINAIESGMSYNDNFDVKYNVIKVIFGS